VLTEFSEGQFEGESRNREDGGAAENVGEFFGESFVGDGVWRCRIPDALDVVLDGVDEHGGDVVDVNPRHPLFAGTEFAAGQGTERRDHTGQGTAVRSEDKADTEFDDAQAEDGGAASFILPGLAAFGEKAAALSGLFGENFIAAISIEADGGGADQDFGPMLYAANGIDQMPGTLNAAVANACFDGGIPALGDGLTGEVDDGIHRIQAVERRLALERVPRK